MENLESANKVDVVARNVSDIGEDSEDADETRSTIEEKCEPQEAAIVDTVDESEANLGENTKEADENENVSNFGERFENKSRCY